MITPHRSVVLTGAVTAALFLSACGGSGTPAEGDRIVVAAPFYALEYAAGLAGGDDVDLLAVTTPGMDPHDAELSPRQMADLGSADLIVYLPGFQPAVDNAIEEAGGPELLDVSEVITLRESGHDHDHDHDDEDHGHEDDDHGHEDDDHGHDDHDHGANDPHFWTDPVLLAEVADAIAVKLAELDPNNAAAYQANQEQIAEIFGDLDEEYASGLATCERRAFIPQHAAFAYLAERYDLEQVSVAGLSPDEEPSPSRIAEIQAEAQAHGITTIFFEPGHSDAIARSIADDLGLDLAVLDPIETLTEDSPGDDYPSIMRANLAALKEANGCS